MQSAVTQKADSAGSCGPQVNLCRSGSITMQGNILILPKSTAHRKGISGLEGTLQIGNFESAVDKKIPALELGYQDCQDKNSFQTQMWHNEGQRGWRKIRKSKRGSQASKPA